MNFGTISLLFKQIFEMTLLKFSLEYLEIFRTLPQSFPSQQDLTSYMMHLNVALTIKKTATKLATVPYAFIFYDKRFFHLKL